VSKPVCFKFSTFVRLQSSDKFSKNQQRRNKTAE